MGGKKTVERKKDKKLRAAGKGQECIPSNLSGRSLSKPNIVIVEWRRTGRRWKYIVTIGKSLHIRFAIVHVNSVRINLTLLRCTRIKVPQPSQIQGELVDSNYRYVCCAIARLN